jgi:hypothetical protein
VGCASHSSLPPSLSYTSFLHNLTYTRRCAHNLTYTCRCPHNLTCARAVGVSTPGRRTLKLVRPRLRASTYPRAHTHTHTHTHTHIHTYTHIHTHTHTHTHIHTHAHTHTINTRRMSHLLFPMGEGVMQVQHGRQDALHNVGLSLTNIRYLTYIATAVLKMLWCGKHDVLFLQACTRSTS